MNKIKTFIFKNKEMSKIDWTINEWAEENNALILSTSMVKTYEDGSYFEIVVSVVYQGK